MIFGNRKYILTLLGVLFLAAVLAAVFTYRQTHDSFSGLGKPYVAVIRIDGPITGGASGNTLLDGGGGITSEELMRELREARRDPQARAILLRINSPGGSTGATQEIAEEMDKIRSAGKPIIVSMGDMCASAGYWLASKGNYIFASPATITGSIGVYMDYTNVEELMDKLGIKNDKIKSGAHKDILSMYRPMTAEERAMIQTMVDDIYNQFVQTVADGRKMDEAKVRAIADGRILTGKQAQDLGLVDAMGNYYDALNYAGNVAGIESDNIMIRTYGKGMSWTEIFSGEISRSGQMLGRAMGEGLKDSVFSGNSSALSQGGIHG